MDLDFNLFDDHLLAFEEMGPARGGGDEGNRETIESGKQWAPGAATPETTCETCAPVRDASVAYTSSFASVLNAEPGIVVSARAGCASCVKVAASRGQNVSARGVMATTALHEAAAMGSEEVVKVLLAHGAEVDAKDKEGRTALWRACEAGRAAGAEALLRAGANRAVDDLRGVSALRAASTLSAGNLMGRTVIEADEERARMVRDLVTHSADKNNFNIDVRTVCGETALVCAARSGAARALEALLDVGADPTIRNTNYQTAYMVLRIDTYPSTEPYVAAVKERLWKSTALLNVISAIQRNYIPLIPRMYLDQGAAAHVNDEVKLSMSTTTPLITACEYSRELTAEMLVDEYGAAVNVANSSGDTPLAVAAAQGHIRIVEMLLARGAAVNMCSRQVPAEKSALACASKLGHLNIVRTLLARGAEINPDGGQTPLMLAAKYGRMNVVRELIRQGASIDAHRDSGTALVLAAEAGRVEVVRALLDAGARTDEEYAHSAVLASCENGHLDVLHLLIERDVDLYVPHGSPQCGNALMFAVSGRHKEIVRVLLSNSVDANATSPRQTALTMAIEKCSFDIAKLLIEGGADVNAPERANYRTYRTPLMNAVRADSLRIVEMLLQRGARMDEKCERGRTPLMMAAHHGCANIAERLIESGADIHIRSYSHKTAIDYAVEARHDSVISLLEAKGAVYEPGSLLSRGAARRCKKHMAAIRTLIGTNDDDDDDDDKQSLPDEFVDAVHELLQKFTDAVAANSKDAALEAVSELLVAMENHSQCLPESISIEFCALLQKLYDECAHPMERRRGWFSDDDSD